MALKDVMPSCRLTWPRFTGPRATGTAALGSSFASIYSAEASIGAYREN